MKKHVSVFWSGYSWTWVEQPTSRQNVAELARCKLSDSASLSLDDAIRDAHAAGFCIRDVNKTNGLISMPGPQPAPPKEEGDEK